MTSENRPRRWRPKSTKRSQPRRSLFWRLRRPLFVFALVVIGVLSVGGYALSQIPLPEEDPLLQTTFICAGDVAEGCNRDNSLAQLSGDEDRVSVPYDALPPVLTEAVIAAEDRDFFEHSGIDPVGILRAAWANLREQDVVQGGSSITQQYVKNAYLSSEQSFERKVKEAVLAVKLERELTKEEILLRYLNTIYFGRGAYGVQAASRVYFGKDVNELGLAEATYLAGLIRSPESADARRGVDDARSTTELETAYERRTLVLEAMLAEGYIDRAQLTEADGTSLEEMIVERREGSNFGVVRDEEYGTDYFVEYVRRFLVEEAGFTDAELFGGGLRVYTTLDYDLQRAAYESVWQTLSEEDDPAGALTSVDADGRVVAMVGGRDWDSSQVNLAVGKEGGGTGRQPGSAFKPFVLATALEQGASAQSLFESPSEVVIPEADAGEPWTVENYETKSHGTVDLIEATQVSSNTVYAQLMDEVGPEKVTELAKRLGITAELEPVHALVLGAGEVSVLDMASAYSTIMRSGERVDPIIVTRVEDAHGNVLRSYEPQRERVIEEFTAQTVSWILNQVIQGGTGSAALITQPAAGKTGTTEEYRDAWFAGFTCRLTTAVWVGYDEANEDGSPRLMDDLRGSPVTGGSLPATIWQRYMDRVTANDELCYIIEPYTFPGDIWNSDLATTTTTEPESDPTTTTTTSSPPTETTVPPPTTSPPTTAPPTTAPAPPPTTAPPTTEPAAPPAG